MTSLTPGVLLIATPQLKDPHFKRSVVLLVASDQQGHVGLILNRPSPLTCEAIAREQGLVWRAPQQQLLVGGPVEGRGLWFVHPPHPHLSAERVGSSLAVSRSREALELLCQEGGRAVRMYAGYAGWGEGQLSRELSRGDWWRLELDLSLVFERPYDEVWEAALSLLGVDPLTLLEDEQGRSH
jgi:putative transcriptional regulator